MVGTNYRKTEHKSSFALASVALGHVEPTATSSILLVSATLHKYFSQLQVVSITL